MKVPRTTNADVLQLATYWTSALAQVELKRREMGPHGPEALHQAGIDGEIRRWREALRDVDNYATTGDPAATYPKNEAFWRATGSASITVAVIDDACAARKARRESWRRRRRPGARVPGRPRRARSRTTGMPHRRRT
jgi:hypothetical protein